MGSEAHGANLVAGSLWERQAATQMGRGRTTEVSAYDATDGRGEHPPQRDSERVAPMEESDRGPPTRGALRG